MTDSDFDTDMDTMFLLAYETLEKVEVTLDFDRMGMFHHHLMHAIIRRSVMTGWTQKELIKDINYTIEQTQEEMGEWDGKTIH